MRINILEKYLKTITIVQEVTVPGQKKTNENLKPRLNISGQKFHISGSGVSRVIVIYNNCGCWFLAQWSAGKVMSAVAGQWPERKYRERHKYVGNRRNL